MWNSLSSDGRRDGCAHAETHAACNALPRYLHVSEQAFICPHTTAGLCACVSLQVGDADEHVLLSSVSDQNAADAIVDSADPHSDLRLFLHNKTVDTMLRQLSAAQRAARDKVPPPLFGLCTWMSVAVRFAFPRLWDRMLSKVNAS